MRRLQVLLLASALAAAAAGCGSGGVSKGATVPVYVFSAASGPAAERDACASARGELARAGSADGEVRLRVACVGGGPGARLAAIGAAARRAAQDSASIAFVTVADPLAARFAAPILEPPGIALVRAASGAAALHRVAAAVQDAGDSSELRSAVRDALAQ